MAKAFKLPTLLVVTSNPSVRFWIKKHMDEQFFIINADNYNQAMDALNARLDFIIVDANLDGCDALALCKELSKRTKKALVPILLITGRLKKSFLDKAIASGVSDFLSDQLNLEELQMRIATGLKAASTRERTEGLGIAIKVPKMASVSLKNKFLLDKQALQLLAAAKEESAPVALLLMRIDQLKNKEVLKPFAQFVKSLLGEKDILISSSQGNFAILLYNTKPEKAQTLAALLQKKIQEEFHLSVSIVLTPFEASEKGFNQMIESAAKSLKAHSETNLILSLDQETA